MNIKEIINKTNGIITAEDFRKFNITKYKIQKFLDDEKFYRYCRSQCNNKNVKAKNKSALKNVKIGIESALKNVKLY